MLLTLVMHVPDSRATIKVMPDGSGIDGTGLKFVCDPFDEFGVEQAVRLKERRDDVTEVVTMTIGPSGAVQTLRTALAMGADRAIHVCDDDLPGHDEVLLAEVLAAAIRRETEPFDLILCGKQAIDNDAGELGPALAEFLQMSHVGAVVNLELEDDGSRLRVYRRIDGAEEVFELPLPALITCEKGLVEPRYPPLPALMKARKKPLETVAPSDLPGLEMRPAATTLVSLSPPAPRGACRMIEGDPVEMARELARVLREEAKVL